MELTPKTRKEVFLAAAGGQDITTPTPVTREEVFLDAIAKGRSGGGSSGGGVLVVNLMWNEDGSADLDKTWQDIFDAVNAGVPVVVKESYEDGFYCNNLIQSVYHQGNYQVDIITVLSGSYPIQYHFETSTATGYPHMSV